MNPFLWLCALVAVVGVMLAAAILAGGVIP